MKKHNWLIICFLLSILSAPAQVLQLVDSSQRGVSFRGISMASEAVAWVSGSRGTVGRTTDGGKTWQWCRPAGYEQRDFRDLHAYSEKAALVMAVDSPGVLLKTTDGGRTWREVYRSNARGIFLDAMDLSGANGACVGDPIDGEFWILTTRDSGNHWTLLPTAKRPAAEAGEAMFAASGSNVLVNMTNDDVNFAFVTGGRRARIFVCSELLGCADPVPLAITQGGSMTGANGLLDYRDGPLVFGGNYEQPKASDSTLCFVDFEHAPAPMRTALGYVSGACRLPGNRVLLCGLGGIAVAPRQRNEKGWTLGAASMWSNTGFHTCASFGSTVLLAGANGRIGRLDAGNGK